MINAQAEHRIIRPAGEVETRQTPGHPASVDLEGPTRLSFGCVPATRPRSGRLPRARK
jgi:hypothetical protein